MHHPKQTASSLWNIKINSKEHQQKPNQQKLKKCSAICSGKEQIKAVVLAAQITINKENGIKWKQIEIHTRVLYYIFYYINMPSCIVLFTIYHYKLSIDGHFWTSLNNVFQGLMNQSIKHEWIF